MLSRRLVAATLALALAAPALALADPQAAPAPPPTAENTEKARAHYKQGKAYQEAGAYDQAITEYLEADRLAPRPELFFNIAQCYRLSGHAEQAIVYYHRFVDAMPEAAGADDARTYIAQLEQQVKKERERKQAAAPARPPVVPAAHAVDEPHARRPALRWVGIGGVVTGAALVGVGAYFGARAADEGDSLGSTHGEWTAELDAREDAAQTDEQRMWLMAAGGGVLIVGGAALWWWAGRRGHVEAAPVVTRESAGLTLRGSF